MDSPPVSVVLIPGFMLDETLRGEFSCYLPEDWAVFHAVTGKGLAKLE